MPDTMTFERYNREQVFLTAWHQEKLAHSRGIDVKGTWRRLMAMGPQELLSRLKLWGINTSGQSIWRYVKDGLISEPHTKGAGQGQGKITDYPEDTPRQFAASYVLRHKGDPYLGKYNTKQTRAARTIALTAMILKEIKPNIEMEKLIRNVVVKEIKDADENMKAQIISRMEDAAVFWYYIYRDPKKFTGI